MNKIEEAVSKLAGPIVEEAGLALWDVEYVKEAGQWFLRIFIDRTGGVGIEDCEKISRTLDPMLDAADMIPERYLFEVSSAGAERQLKRPEDFALFLGHLAEVKLYRSVYGAKEHVGKLQAYQDGHVTIETGGEVRLFQQSDIAIVRLRIG